MPALSSASSTSWMPAPENHGYAYRLVSFRSIPRAIPASVGTVQRLPVRSNVWYSRSPASRNFWKNLRAMASMLASELMSPFSLSWVIRAESDPPSRSEYTASAIQRLLSRKPASQGARRMGCPSACDDYVMSPGRNRTRRLAGLGRKQVVESCPSVGLLAGAKRSIGSRTAFCASLSIAAASCCFELYPAHGDVSARFSGLFPAARRFRSLLERPRVVAHSLFPPLASERLAPPS